MRVYDLVLVLKSSLTEEKRKKLLDTVTSWLQDAKVEIADKGQKPLSYAIKKELSGYYVQLTLETKELIPAEFEKRVMAQVEVLRHLVLRKK